MPRTPTFPIPSIELGSNSSISDSKPRTWLELLHSRFQASNLARTLLFPIPRVKTWLKLLHSRFQASNLSRPLPFSIQSVATRLNLLHFRFQASNLSRTPLYPIPSLELGSHSSILDSKFEQSSTLVIGNGGVRAKFRRLESEKEEFETSSMLGVGNGGV